MKLNELLYEREERKYSFNPKTKKVEDNLIELLKKQMMITAILGLPILFRIIITKIQNLNGISNQFLN